MDKQQLIEWILDGDPAIQYKARLELLGEDPHELEALKESLPNVDGYIKEYLLRRDPMSGKWGNGIYIPKWISTHYTLLELKNMNCPGSIEAYRESALILTDDLWYEQGFIRKDRYVDLCVAAMVGSILCHGHIDDVRISEIMDYMLAHIQKDGGFNCSWQTSEVNSVHTTLVVLQFFLDYERYGYTYRLEEVKKAVIPAEECLLERELYKNRKTGEPVLKHVVNMPYPTRYKYDFLKSLEYFVDRSRQYDERMEAAIELLLSKQRKSGAWPCTGNYQGQVHFKIADEGRDHRMNTLRALKVLKAYRNR